MFAGRLQQDTRYRPESRSEKRCVLLGPAGHWRLGLEHGNAFEKIAIYGNKKWQERVSKIGSWFISGDVRYFESKS